MLKKKSILILHDIRSAHNVGAIFRTAEAAGIEKIYLTGITPAPLDRFGKPRKDVAKASLGAEKIVAWEARKTIAPVLSKLKKEGFAIAAIEQSAQSLDYKKYKPTTNVAFVVGNEVTGIPPSILKRSDTILEIPMRGRKESLNVSVATGIALYRVLGI